MDKHTTTTTRNDIALVRFGGRVWEMTGRKYNTVTLKDKAGNEIRAHRDRVVLLNDRAVEMMEHGSENEPTV